MSGEKVTPSIIGGKVIMDGDMNIDGKVTINSAGMVRIDAMTERALRAGKAIAKDFYGAKGDPIAEMDFGSKDSSAVKGWTRAFGEKFPGKPGKYDDVEPDFSYLIGEKRVGTD